MNFEDLKKKAIDLKNDLEPKIKETAGKAGRAVSGFVDEHIKKRPNGEGTENAPEGETDFTEEGTTEDEVVRVNAEEVEVSGDTESMAEKISNKFGQKKKNRKEAKSVKFKEAGEDLGSEEKDEGASGTDTEFDEGEDIGEEPEDSVGEEDETKQINGEIVGSMKDKYNQLMSNVMPKVKDVAVTAGSKVKDVAVVAGSKVKDAAAAAGGKVKDVAVTAGGKVMGAASNVGEKVKDAASNMGEKVKDTFSEIGPRAKRTGETISFQGYRIRKTLGKKIRGTIKRKLGFKKSDSPDVIKYYEVRRKKQSKFLGHARTIRTHRRLVFKHCLKAGIPFQGLVHDLSKYSPSEFYYGVKFFRGDRSPNEGEREDHGFSYAWMHHKGRNKHHFEYWNDYNIAANKAMPVKMPLKYVIEMFCDRVAASKVYLKGKYTCKSPYEYFDKGRSRRTIHQETSDFLEKLLKMLADKGEEYTFMYIKWYKKHHKDY